LCNLELVGHEKHRLVAQETLDAVLEQPLPDVRINRAQGIV
jgi:hypothetical protein